MKACLHHAAIFVWVAALSLQGGSAAGGETLLLDNGGRIRGRLVDHAVNHSSPDASRGAVGLKRRASSNSAAKNYVVRTAAGMRIVIAADEVQEVRRSTAAEEAYRKQAPKYADRVDPQWRLAEWCREQQLDALRRRHLQRIVELDPNHIQARRGLGHSQVQGRWATQAQIQTERGYVYHRGRWRTTQEVELQEGDRAVAATERQWMLRLKQWRKELNSERWAEAARRIAAIRDPHAIRCLLELARTEPRRPVKLLYVEALGGIHSGPALAGLVQLSLHDVDEEVFYACLEQLVRYKSPDAAIVYVRALKSPNNLQVNRAAEALGSLGEQQAISPLIDSLMTTHFSIQHPSSAITSIFPAGSNSAVPRECVPLTPANAFTLGGLTVSKKARVLSRRVSNQAVLDALVKLTGVSLGFDQRAWRYWHDAQRAFRRASPGNRDEIADNAARRAARSLPPAPAPKTANPPHPATSRIDYR